MPQAVFARAYSIGKIAARRCAFLTVITTYSIKLVLTQRLRGMDARGAACGQEAGQQIQADQRKRRRNDGGRAERRYAIDQTCRGPCYYERQANTECQTYGGHARSLP